jgi:hypothetical protein
MKNLKRLGRVGGVSPEHASEHRARLVDGPSDLARRRLDEADEGRAKFIEARQLGQCPDPVHVENGVAHRSAQDLELVGGLGEIHGNLGGRDRIDRSRDRGSDL